MEQAEADGVTTAAPRPHGSVLDLILRPPEDLYYAGPVLGVGGLKPLPDEYSRGIAVDAILSRRGYVYVFACVDRVWETEPRLVKRYDPTIKLSKEEGKLHSQLQELRESAPFYVETLPEEE